MSALRICRPGCAPILVDLGPGTWVPIHGRATMHGHVVRPDEAPDPSVAARRESNRRAAAAYRARQSS